MDKNFVVYMHYTIDTNELFYIGEGRLKRAFSKWSRNRYWHFKVKKHGGFRVVIHTADLTKPQAEAAEKELIISHRNAGVALTNFCEGPAFSDHWLAGKPKEFHPMFNKKRPDAAIRLTEWNKLHTGELSPTFGRKREDLADRNRSQSSRSIYIVEKDLVVSSVAEAAKVLNVVNVGRAINKPHLTAGGCHLVYHTDFLKMGLDKIWAMNSPKADRRSNVARPVRCIETGQIFTSCQDALRFINRKTPLQPAIRNGYSVGGYYWEFVN